MIIDVSDATFEADVLQRSMTTPVVVDLWAPWCGPCKTLTPILEKVVGEAAGGVVLAKINVDENPGASQAFSVQSIPAVFALSGGQVVNGFTGAMPEDKVREFVTSLVVDETAGQVAGLVAQGDEESLRKANELDPSNPEAAASLAAFLLDSGDGAGALEVLAKVDDDRLGPLVDAAREMALPGVERDRIEAELVNLLPTVKSDDEARSQFVELLNELVIGDPEAAAKWRRKLSTALF